jgi:hypothetical protein
MELQGQDARRPRKDPVLSGFALIQPEAALADPDRS